MRAKLTILTAILFSSCFFFSCSISKKPVSKNISDFKSFYEANSNDFILKTFLDTFNIINEEQKVNFNTARKNIKYIIANISKTKFITLSDVYNLKGLINLKENETEDAILNFTQALEHNSKNLGSKKGLATAYLQNKDLKNSKKHFKNILKNFPNDYSSIANLGIINSLEGNQKEALSLFQKAIAIKPDDFKILYNIAEIHFINGDTVKAKSFYRKSIEKNPNALKPLSNLSFLLIKDKKFKSINELFKNKTRLSSNSSSAYQNNHALANRFSGNLKEAERNYLSALNINPKSKNALLNLGILYDVYMGKRKFALKYYEKYIELNGKGKERVLKWVKIIKGINAIK